MSEIEPEGNWELPIWAQFVGGLWCLLTAILFVRQIMTAYLALLVGG